MSGTGYIRKTFKDKPEKPHNREKTIISLMSAISAS
jgi:hypothetical protein